VAKDENEDDEEDEDDEDAEDADGDENDGLDKNNEVAEDDENVVALAEIDRINENINKTRVDGLQTLHAVSNQRILYSKHILPISNYSFTALFRRPGQEQCGEEEFALLCRL